VGTTVLIGCIDPTYVRPLDVVPNPATFTITNNGSSCSGLSITPTPTPSSYTPLVNNIVATGGILNSGSPPWNYNKLYWSHNNGNTWSIWNGPTTGATYTFTSATIINGGNTIYSIVGSNFDVNEYIYASYDAGTSFTQVAHFSGENIQHLVCSKLGQYVVSVGLRGVYISTNYGLSFSQVSGINLNYNNVLNIANWNRATISQSGQYIAVTNQYNNMLFQSSDYGNSWTSTSTSGYTVNGIGFAGIRMSADGSIRTATNGYQIYVSNDYGSTWILKQTQQLYYFNHKISMSDDGKYQLAATAGGNNGAKIQRSIDYGQTWSDNLYESINNSHFTGVSVSPDGATMTAVNSQSLHMYRSLNYGNTWQTITPHNQFWGDIDMK